MGNQRTKEGKRVSIKTQMLKKTITPTIVALVITGVLISFGSPWDSPLQDKNRKTQIPGVLHCHL